MSVTPDPSIRSEDYATSEAPSTPVSSSIHDDPIERKDRKISAPPTMETPLKRTPFLTGPETGTPTTNNLNSVTIPEEDNLNQSLQQSTLSDADYIGKAILTYCCNSGGRILYRSGSFLTPKTQRKNSTAGRHFPPSEKNSKENLFLPIFS